MRILIAHSRYLSGPSSGENRMAEDEAKLLSDAGHDVQLWSPEPDVGSKLDVVKTGDRLRIDPRKKTIEVL